ncbi:MULTISPECIES: glycosyltransferase family 4 protein [unclassified Mesorhizobium]|uniref:glycosyltransferase family 4 protein n=1 Tax=unclassified Mesorhizobium TaxID=325217 RepID=UPI000FE7B5FD|nr:MULTISPECIES: glycosyltransferase family 4 protein [unclassified Mesorhizobium]RWC25133.1 MAG: glycosyltransferase [Mesorhizobium sp.]RWD48753.1 MAG: glycosyltransferase [Mesorhizobium sp.]TGT95212.1 glycosyltransferase [Mesorhizobium sp. M5C.F.Ca.ET.164.01.1.1]TIS38246.1 MAG: glycosyltransferase family 4 protein [Mesorhizobium sp.]TIU28075.1 MAG: glycosyltransferase family 4 protein [Mesorhizobium sp.]
MISPKVVVQQIGARMDYAVPRALFRDGILGKFVTDLHFSSPLSAQVATLQRYRSEIPDAYVLRNLRSGFAYRLLLRFWRGEAWPHQFASEALAGATVQAIKETGANILYGFDTALLPILSVVNELGCNVILEQCIAPRMQMIKLIPALEQRVARKGISSSESGLGTLLGYLEVLSAIEQAEWRRSALIVCPSRFVRDELIGLGVSESKTIVIPYGVNITSDAEPRRFAENRKLKVAFVGAFSYRKGAIDYCQLASRYHTHSEFHIFGSIMLPDAVMRRLSRDVIVRGHLSREDLFRELKEFDVLVLPSYSEGSATVIYECMALGLVCIVSHASGSVITSGVDGVIFDAGDENGMHLAFENVLGSPSLRRSMSEAAVETSKENTRDSYGARVVNAIEKFSKGLEG